MCFGLALFFLGGCMLKTVVLRNVQSHKESVLELSKNLNVIHGDSDQGKSCFIRALTWFFTNKIPADLIRTHETKLTKVSISNEDCSAERLRSDSKNEYRMDGDVYKSFKTGVPEDVLNAFNISEVNIQNQKDTFFLIDKSPGFISKELNKVSGLDAMDDVLKETNQEIREIKNKLSHHKADYSELSKNEIELRWIFKAKARLNSITRLNQEVNDIENKINLAELLIEKIEELEKLKSNLFPKSFSKDLNALIAEKEKLEKTERMVNITHQISCQHNTFSKLKDEIFVIDKTEIQNLEKIESRISKIGSKINNAENLISRHTNLILQQKKAETEVKKSKRIFIKELKKIGKCPLCGAKQ